MVNFGNTSIADLRLGTAQVQAAYLGNKQVWSLGPVVPEYDVKSIGRSVLKQGTSVEITEQAGETITLYIKTDATDLTNKQVCAAVYLNSTDVIPYASFAFSNVSLAGRYITGTTPDVSTWVPSGFPETYSTLYMKTWIQDAGQIDPADALGEVLDWTGEEPATSIWLYFTAEQANSTVRLDKAGSPAAVSLETSTDGTAWTDYSWSGTTGATMTLANVGDKVYFRAKTENQTFSAGGSNRYHFKTTGGPRVAGNVQSLLKADCSRTDAPANCYWGLFWDAALDGDASGLAVPATQLGTECYNCMFRHSGLVTPPRELPATQAAQLCYSGMFIQCGGLTAAPEIRLTALARSCCGSMFDSTSVVSACLPAATLAQECYAAMFHSDYHLSALSVGFTQWSPSDATNYWTDSAQSNGVFYCPAALGDDSTIERGIYRCPTSWTVVNV